MPINISNISTFPQNIIHYSNQNIYKKKRSMSAHSNTVASPPSLDSPRPLQWLHETPIPPFLSKAYDLVDDPSLDSIISWGDRNGNSFVVWNPVEFARSVLPRNFKHDNFSSFVRQLNTYGFRKIDTDKWEFANEGFVRGQRHLLKKIQRRRSHHSHQLGEPSNEDGKAVFEGEMKELRRERSLMMQEVIELQHQQRGTVQRVEIVKEKLEEAERRQKQLVSFLARMFDKPAFLARLSRVRERNSIAPPRTKWRLVKHHRHELGTLSSTENWARRVEDSGQDELAMVNELLHIPEKGDSVPTLQAIQPLVQQDGVMNPPPRSANDTVVMENGAPEFLIAGNESVVSEDAWNMDLEADMCCYNTDPWCCLGSYNALDLGICSGLSDVSELGSMQVRGSSGMKWLDEEPNVN